MLKPIKSNNSPGHSHNGHTSVVGLSFDSCPGNISKEDKQATDYNIEALHRIAYRTGKYDGRSARHLKFDKCETCENDATLIWFYEDDMYLECENCNEGSYCKSCIIEISGKEWNDNFKNSDYYCKDEYTDEDNVTLCGTCYHQYIYNKRG